jgi:cell division protein FtsQ
VTEEQRESLARRFRREWRRRKPLAIFVRVWRYVAARRVLAAVLAALVVLSTGTIVYATGVFDVRHVRVVGASRATTVRIDNLAHSAVGDSMLTVSTSSLRRRIAALPEVAAVHVARDWPDTLRLTVTERLAVVAVHQPGGWLLVDRAATPYLSVTQLPARVLPLVVAGATAGDPTLRAAVDVVLALPSTVRRTVDAVSAPSVAGIQLRLRGGGTVIWGGPEDSARKARALAVLLAQQTRTHAHTHVYDVSTPGFVTTS